MSDHLSTAAPTVWFPAWSEVLQQQARLSPVQRQQYQRAIIEYLRYCKRSRQRATVDSAREFMRQGGSGAATDAGSDRDLEAGVELVF